MNEDFTVISTYSFPFVKAVSVGSWRSILWVMALHEKRCREAEVMQEDTWGQLPAASGQVRVF